ncbi:MAG: D-alanyl-D-alanine carboxypeptidase family protein [Pseudomonadota bacterium]|jgi:D-alanyl-D-alanine carboxypeptidase|nr:MAG: serine-type D-Ala-D-Ala carboxypeptidase [Pseudomonadota bacterium]
MLPSPSVLSLVLLCLVALIGPARAAVPIPKPPAVDARAYILIDSDSGRVLGEMNADERVEPASLTKLMTGYAVFLALREGRLKLDEPVTISERAWRAEGSRTFLQVGSRVPVEVLIKGMIVQSGNDATIALAERIAGTEEAFVQLMNEYAKQLGMNSTSFENSSGLPGPNHYTTARDMAILARTIIREFPEYYRWYSEREFTWNNITQRNRNGLLYRDPSVDGMKTGHTQSAGYCLVSSANRQGMRLISVVMGSKSVKAREDASAALLNYGYTFYETVKVKGSGEKVLEPRVYKAATALAPVGVAQDIYVTVPRGEAAKLRTETRLNEPLVAPLEAGTAVGELTVTTESGEVVASAPLVSLQPVPEGGLWTLLIDSVALWFH